MSETQRGALFPLLGWKIGNIFSLFSVFIRIFWENGLLIQTRVLRAGKTRGNSRRAFEETQDMLGVLDFDSLFSKRPLKLHFSMN